MSGQRQGPAAFYPRERIRGTHLMGAGRASELVWTQRLEEKSIPSAGDRILFVQSVASRLDADR
jgi:hypothetical protein